MKGKKYNIHYYSTPNAFGWITKCCIKNKKGVNVITDISESLAKKIISALNLYEKRCDTMCGFASYGSNQWKYCPICGGKIVK